MGDEITGGCKCGSVRYSGARSDVEMFRCYCRDCQRLTGTGHSDMVPLDARGLTLTGDYKEYEMTGGSGQSTWSGFCGTCGSQIMRRSAFSDSRLYVHAASLDDPSIYAPTRIIYVDAAQPWDRPSE